MSEKTNSGIDSIIQINYLTPKNAVFSVTENGFLKLKATVENPEKENAVEELSFERVFLHRSFPFSNPYKFISVLGQFPKKEPEKTEEKKKENEQATTPEEEKTKDDVEKMKKNNEVTSFGDIKEIGVINDFNDFGSDMAEKLKKVLERKYFMPVIKDIVSIKEKYGYSYWTVDTDVGKIQFTVPDPYRNILKLGTNRLIINDINGNRYDIPDIEALGVSSMRKIDLFL